MSQPCPPAKNPKSVVIYSPSPPAALSRAPRRIPGSPAKNLKIFVIYSPGPSTPKPKNVVLYFPGGSITLSKAHRPQLWASSSQRVAESTRLARRGGAGLGWSGLAWAGWLGWAVWVGMGSDGCPYRARLAWARLVWARRLLGSGLGQA